MKVLSIGAGKEQIFSIQEAKRMGLIVIGIDGDKDAPGFAYCDVTYNIDLKEVNDIIKVARKHQIKFVLPVPIGGSLITIGKVNDELNLKGISETAAISFVHKSEFYRCLEVLNLPRPKQIILKESKSKIHELKRKINIIGYPCVIKPSIGSGSRGVGVIRSNEELDQLLEFHHSTLLKDEATLIESFIEGTEYGIDGRIVNGKFELLLIREKILTNLPFRQEIGYLAPARIHPPLEQSIILILQQLTTLIQANNCLFHADIIINNDGIFVIESSGRPAGLNLMTHFIPHVIGFNPISNFIAYLMGKALYCPNIKVNKVYMICFFDLKPGIVKVIPQKDKDFNVQKVLYYDCQLRVNEFIHVVKQGKDIVNRGYFIVCGDDFKNCEGIAENIFSKFIIE
ncbi:acetyl-CoA carboxylase biotin carboxylase subunit family protein [Cytobacillus solani]|uniref:ATP-grasp domain-containing protein n=1 Tax=Cytobacillus solani TaxID=1637975 RepID=A0A0Q3VH46_9BACI|nr:ATP-grasp domain-containing protein [Cytobacillus solani]KOP82297.1 hypothetical protein AMS60_07225 [Bacillus sp. FJAT-21945]KQL19307.1 hypothetical protein AN957_12495 [Cytobacillus solani]